MYVNVNVNVCVCKWTDRGADLTEVAVVREGSGDFVLVTLVSARIPRMCGSAVVQCLEFRGGRNGFVGGIAALWLQLAADSTTLTSESSGQFCVTPHAFSKIWRCGIIIWMTCVPLLYTFCCDIISRKLKITVNLRLKFLTSTYYLLQHVSQT